MWKTSDKSWFYHWFSNRILDDRLQMTKLSIILTKVIYMNLNSSFAKAVFSFNSIKCETYFFSSWTMALPIVSFCDSSFVNSSLLCFNDDSHSCIRLWNETKKERKVQYKHKRNDFRHSIDSVNDILFVNILDFSFHFYFQLIFSLLNIF